MFINRYMTVHSYKVLANTLVLVLSNGNYFKGNTSKTYVLLAFFADSEKRTPLFPMIPTGYPNIRANPE